MSAFLYSPKGNLHLIPSSEEWKIENVLDYLSNSNRISLHPDNVYILLNGRLLQSDEQTSLAITNNDVIRVHHRLPGGKGGFGSMLRAIGAQIEKTTSREACRDLSGRRMRDVNDEKKITEWVAKQAEREREQARQKQERLERRRAMPKHNFDDQSYTKEIQKNLERIDDALKQGLKASASSSAASSSAASTSGLKRKGQLKDSIPTKRKMWMDEELEDSEEEMDNEPISNVQTASTSTSTKPDLEQTITKTSEGCSHNEETASPKKIAEVTASNDFTETKKLSANIVDEDSSPKLSTKTDGMNEETENKESCEEEKPFCIDEYNTAEELESIGLDQLKVQLVALGLKCGGTLQERAQRLFATKGKALKDLDPSFFAKPSKGKKQKKK